MTKEEFLKQFREITDLQRTLNIPYFYQDFPDNPNYWSYTDHDDIFHREIDLKEIEGKVLLTTTPDGSHFSMDECENVSECVFSYEELLAIEEESLPHPDIEESLE